MPRKVRAKKGNAPVEFIRAELVAKLKQYELIEDCVEGDETIKAMGTKYLPQPNAEDVSKANMVRYQAYITRANFYNVTKRTLEGLSGQLFLRDPEVKVPSIMAKMAEDIDGAGVSLFQQVKRAAQHVIGKGRAGLLVDYPTVAEPTSLAALDAGEIRPTISLYNPTDIINWRTISRGARTLLSLVVLRETYTENTNIFETDLKTQYRVLTLNEKGHYTVQVYRNFEKGYKATTAQIVTGANGLPLTEIPFTFIGAVNNDSEVDEPPMYSIASLNIAHYRNSADYEEACFMLGQPTPWFAGLTEQWVKKVLNGTVSLGSRAAIPLPVGASAGLLQVNPNTMPLEAMKLKEAQMISLGAKLIEEKAVQRTATEVVSDDTSANSVLATVAANLSQAYTWALKQMALFVGTSDTISFAVNRDFAFAKLTPEERRQLLAEWQGGAITFTEMRTNLRRGGVASIPDEQAKSTILSELSDIPGIAVNVDNNIRTPDNAA